MPWIISAPHLPTVSPRTHYQVEPGEMRLPYHLPYETVLTPVAELMAQIQATLVG